MRLALGPLLLALAALPAIALSIDYGVWSMGMPGSGLVPLIGAGLLLIAAVGSAFAPSPPADAESDAPGDPRRQAGYVGGLLALPPLTIALGMLPALALFLLSILYFVERTSKTTAVGVATATAVGAWLLFERLLSVPLPRSTLW